MSNETLTILTLVRSYLPGYRFGGPVRSIANMVVKLGDLLHFKIVTSDRDELDTQSYQGMSVNAWNTVGKAQVFYCSPKKRSFFAIRRLLLETDHDVLYFNSFFDPVFTIKPLLMRRFWLLPARPVVLAPRGEFSVGAVNLKPWKKKLYILLARALRLFDDAVWHASSPYEADDIRRVIGEKGPIMVASVLPSLEPVDPLANERTKETDGLRVVYLSRITRKKNLDAALRILGTVESNVEFNIYGPVGDESYWRTCQALIRSLPANVRCDYWGSIDHEKVTEVFAQHDLLFLPTRGENFGHVILEALSAGTPVLISDQTPWRQDEGGGACRVVPLENDQGFARVIDELARTNEPDYRHLRVRATEMAERYTQSDESVENNRRVFERAVENFRNLREAR